MAPIALRSQRALIGVLRQWFASGGWQQRIDIKDELRESERASEVQHPWNRSMDRHLWSTGLSNAVGHPGMASQIDIFGQAAQWTGWKATWIDIVGIATPLDIHAIASWLDIFGLAAPFRSPVEMAALGNREIHLPVPDGAA